MPLRLKLQTEYYNNVLITGRELPTGQNVVSVAPIEVPDGKCFICKYEIENILEKILLIRNFQ